MNALTQAVARIERQTPAHRDRAIDGLRALALLAVPTGHWLLGGFTRDGDGALHNASPLSAFAGFAPVSWILQMLGIFFLVLGGAWLAMEAGFRPSSVGSQTGTFVAAYIVTKLTQPLRIAATVLLTPLVARIYERVTGRSRTNSPPVDG